MAPLEETEALGFQGGHDDRGAKVFGNIPRGDADIPALGEPFRPFIISQGTGWNGVDRLAAVAVFDEQFKHVRLAGARGGL